jgi:hypothetical protein
MNTLTLSLAAAGAAALCTFGALSLAQAQDEAPPAAAVEHGNWTLSQREDWLKSRLDKAKDDGSLDRHEYDRVKDEINDIHHDEGKMRGRHDHGELTDNETADLEARLDHVADQIHWLHENTFQRPW